MWSLELAIFLDVGIWILDVLAVPRPRIIFITGTDTGVGKTLLTSLLLAHLRARGIRPLALKPFCSGSRSDALLLHSLMEDELTLDEINPFYFPEPIAPLIAARKHHRRISLRHVLSHISRITHPPSVGSAKEGRASRIVSACSHAPTLPPSTLLIEGAGGLLSPLAEDCTALDVICSLGCEVLVVAPNKLGTINHTLLTIRTLRQSATRATDSPRPTRIVLMNCPSPDLSAASNPRILSELLAPIQVSTLPFLGRNCRTSEAIRTHSKVLNQKLSRLLKRP